MLLTHTVEFVWCDAVLWIRAFAVVTSNSIDTDILTIAIVVITLIHIYGMKVIEFNLQKSGFNVLFQNPSFYLLNDLWEIQVMCDSATFVMTNFHCTFDLHEAIGVIVTYNKVSPLKSILKRFTQLARKPKTCNYNTATTTAKSIK